MPVILWLVVNNQDALLLINSYKIINAAAT